MVHAYAGVKPLQAGCCGKVSFPDASGLSATKDTCWESVAVVLPLVIWGASLLDRTQVVVLHGPVHLAHVSGLTDHILGMLVHARTAARSLQTTCNVLLRRVFS